MSTPRRFRAVGRRLAALLAASLMLALPGCSITPAVRTPALTYDFGPLPAAPAYTGGLPLLIHEVAAPVWLDSPNMVYRLNYANPAEPRAYTMSRWISSPAQLLTQRLRAAGMGLAPTDGVRADHALRVELLEFSHIFDSPERSRGVLRLRATLSRNGSLVARRELSLERPAPSPDAAGGAYALAGAADAAALDVAAWARAALPAR